LIYEVLTENGFFEVISSCTWLVTCSAFNIVLRVAFAGRSHRIKITPSSQTPYL
jgi:hypothetical protein